MPAPYTQLSPTATPGKRYSFSAKAEAVSNVTIHDFVVNVYTVHDMDTVVDTVSDMVVNVHTVHDMDVEK